jgi:hypothetical protein
MKLSPKTVNLLKNFASIQPNMLFVKGNSQQTMAELGNIVCEAEIEEDFSQEFGISDLSEFLSVFGMFQSPELSFDDSMTSVNFKEGNRSVKYFVSDPSIITSPKKKVKIPDVALSFTLTAEDLLTLRKASSALKVEHMVITKATDSTISVKMTDIDDVTSNAFNLELSSDKMPEEDFKFIYRISNLKVLSGDYVVEISSKRVTKLTDSTQNLVYFISLEIESTYGE